MNKVRRSNLSKAIDLLDQARAIIEEMMDEEQEAFDNLPESFQCSERGEQMEEYIYILETAVDNIEEIASGIEDEVINA